ncbi:hypothetical protein [Pseudomonas syringae]|uniref:hypothetical protein n=1 Tax=Pseudomonas syringae TaxID=317 RepID=UPI000A1F1B95|nr:hypothetical protein [Pseudomonas syringae]OSN39538.1 hypothetical protein BV342_01249 [Pseudomonas syringae pv. actinidiae]OSR62615.1 hypothetical protein BV325_01653 [Pseudomonas syringae pv. actinidiae]OSR79942.1 hypothetical protein BV328_01639 [Pseudomonas syringae pv. actinidiae]
MKTKTVHFVSHSCGPQECDCVPRCHQRAGDEIRVTGAEEKVTCKNCLSAIEADKKRGRHSASKNELDSKTPDIAGPSGELSFCLEGVGFVGMPLERVAKYIGALSELVGDTAVFVRMTDNSIVFYGASRAPSSEVTQ